MVTSVVDGLEMVAGPIFVEGGIQDLDTSTQMPFISREMVVTAGVIGGDLVVDVEDIVGTFR